MCLDMSVARTLNVRMEMRSSELVLSCYHVNDHFPQSLPLLLVEIYKDITVWVLQQLESHGKVMILQHRLVVVHQRELRAFN